MIENLEGEEWRDIEGYEGLYQVSNKGNVKSLNYRRSGKEKKLRPEKLNGYLLVCLSKDKKHKGFLVHRLVAKYFLENPDNLPVVNHKDENKENNSSENLEWCTQRYNVNYGTGIQRRSESQKGLKRSEETKRKMRESHIGFKGKIPWNKGLKIK